MKKKRILSGMRPTGSMHLGHVHGALLNWKKLQDEYECFYAIVDWHALTSEYANPEIIGESIYDIAMDWISVGLDPEISPFFHSIPHKRARRASLNFVHDYTPFMAGEKSYI